MLRLPTRQKSLSPLTTGTIIDEDVSPGDLVSRGSKKPNSAESQSLGCHWERREPESSDTETTLISLREARREDTGSPFYQQAREWSLEREREKKHCKPTQMKKWWAVFVLAWTSRAHRAFGENLKVSSCDVDNDFINFRGERFTSVPKVGLLSLAFQSATLQHRA